MAFLTLHEMLPLAFDYAGQKLAVKAVFLGMAFMSARYVSQSDPVISIKSVFISLSLPLAVYTCFKSACRRISAYELLSLALSSLHRTAPRSIINDQISRI